MGAKTVIEEGRSVLGIELGSTRIKAVLIDEAHTPIASGSFDWENRLEDGVWTYHLDEVWKGVQGSFARLREDVLEKYGVSLTKIRAMGVSGMMHGYLAFDKQGELLVPFRTWRNTMTGEAAQKLTEVFSFPIPQRWSIAHLYQAILKDEAHVGAISYLTTLAGYIHWKLTGEKVLGAGEASGMFPVDSASGDFRSDLIEVFDRLTAEKGYSWKLREILPKVLLAGEVGGVLTEEGARLLDPTGTLESGARLCPPEGDAGTGMTATNSVAMRRGNVSAGTSVFAMVVLERELKKLHRELDLVTTPDGSPVAMVHCNNCTSDLNAWVNLFSQFCEMMGHKVDMGELFGHLYQEALKGDPDCGGLLAYNYLSGEHITGLDAGRPLFVRKPDSNFTLANFMRVHLYTALGALKSGMDILLKDEGIGLDGMVGHGGLFKTPLVGQKMMAAAMGVPVSVMETAGEGGPWGMALLAAYMERREKGKSLADYLQEKVFSQGNAVTVEPDEADVAGYAAFMEHYRAGLAIEQAAVKAF